MKRFAFSLLLMSAATVVGCGKKEDPAPTEKATPPETVSVKSSTTNVTPPAEIVAQFLDGMRTGNEETISRLLTNAAREELTKQGLVASPPGSPEAKIVIRETRFVDTDKDAAFVETTLTEPNPITNLPEIAEVVWAVRAEAGGWRVQGFFVDQGADQEPLVMDFEDLSSFVDIEQPASGSDQQLISPQGDGQPQRVASRPNGGSFDPNLGQGNPQGNSQSANGMMNPSQSQGQGLSQPPSMRQGNSGLSSPMQGSQLRSSGQN